MHTYSCYFGLYLSRTGAAKKGWEEIGFAWREVFRRKGSNAGAGDWRFACCFAESAAASSSAEQTSSVYGCEWNLRARPRATPLKPVQPVHIVRLIRQWWAKLKTTTLQRNYRFNLIVFNVEKRAS